MTWEFQSALSDDVHRLLARDGEVAWGIDHEGFDANDPAVLGCAEVELPAGPKTLLLMAPLQGGLVLDVVRAYQGLTEGELCTFFLGIIDDLRESAEARSRLDLAAFGLDSEGRPRIVPGVRRQVADSSRRAVGEMLYHACFGRRWTECLLPVNIALSEVSAPLRSLVAELFDEARTSSSLTDTLAEVGQALRRLTPPSALPLIPADHDIDPGRALTARLRAADGHPAHRPEAEKPTAEPSETSTQSLALQLRAASRRKSEAGREPTSCGAGSQSRTKGHRGDRHRSRAGDAGRVRSSSPRGELLRRERRAVMAGGARRRTVVTRIREVSLPKPILRPGRFAVIAAVVLTVLGGIIMVRTWGGTSTASTTTAEEHANSDRSESVPEGSEALPDVLDEGEVVRILRNLCDRRAAALSAGDSAALSALTVPDSDAAAADELIDPSTFADSEYTIDLTAITVEAIRETSIVVSALMTASATAGGEDEEFEAKHVAFDLSLSAEEWKVAKVEEVGD